MQGKNKKGKRYNGREEALFSLINRMFCAALAAFAIVVLLHVPHVCVQNHAQYVNSLSVFTSEYVIFQTGKYVNVHARFNVIQFTIQLLIYNVTLMLIEYT